MPHFVYRAKQGPGRTVEGELFAENEAAALARIEKLGCCPVWVREKEPGSGLEGAGFAFRRARQRDVTVFTRQLASLIKAGVPILRALRTVREQSESRRFRLIVGDIERTVRDGRMLSEAISGHPALFPELYVNMVVAGESAGKLDMVLFRLAEAREKEDEVRKKIKSALAYPALVLSVGVVTVLAMLIVFLPKITRLFRNFTDLPLPTRLLMALSDRFSQHWLWLGIVLLLLIVLHVFRRITSGGKGRLLVDTMKLHAPVLGAFVREADIARFARTMSLLVSAGIPVEKGLALGAATLRNSVIRNEIKAVREGAVRQGMSIAAGLQDARHFPVYARNMVAVGEEGGSLDESFADVASFYEKEVERRIGTMTTLIEPVLILVVGAVVGFIVFAMMLPVFALARTIR